MLAALDHAAEDPEVRAIVFTGAGRAFSSGADLKAGGEFGRERQAGRAAPGCATVYNPLILRVRTVPKPVIAAVNGPAVGIGCSLALACDLIVAAESAYFLLAFVNIGLGLDGGASMTLPARVGHARAFEIAYLGERIPAAQALDWGLVNRVVADAELTAAASALAGGSPPARPAPTRRSSARSTTGLRRVRGAARPRGGASSRSAPSPRTSWRACSSFMQKRPPQFTRRLSAARG